MDRFSWCDGLLGPDEQLIATQTGVRIYDGDDKVRRLTLLTGSNRSQNKHTTASSDPLTAYAHISTNCHLQLLSLSPFSRANMRWSQHAGEVDSDPEMNAT
jgi:hypothetical protein